MKLGRLQLSPGQRRVVAMALAFMAAFLIGLMFGIEVQEPFSFTTNCDQGGNLWTPPPIVVDKSVTKS